MGDMQKYVMFEKGEKKKKWGNDWVFDKWWWEKWVGICRKVKVDGLVRGYRKMN